MKLFSCYNEMMDTLDFKIVIAVEDFEIKEEKEILKELRERFREEVKYQSYIGTIKCKR